MRLLRFGVRGIGGNAAMVGEAGCGAGWRGLGDGLGTARGRSEREWETSQGGWGIGEMAANRGRGLGGGMEWFWHQV